MARGRDGGKAGDAAARMAWSLAAEAVAVRHEHTSKAKSGGRPACALRETGALFRSLQADPFGTVTKIVNDETLKDVDAKRKAALAELVQAFTEPVSAAQSAGGSAADRRVTSCGFRRPWPC